MDALPLAQLPLAEWAAYAAIPPCVNIARECLDLALARGEGDRIAVVSERGALTYAALAAHVTALAAHLADLGIARGDRVLIRMWNCQEFVAAFLALAKIGAVPVLQNTAAGPPDIEYVLGHSDAVAAIALDELAAPLRTLAQRYLPKGLVIARSTTPRQREHRFEDMITSGVIATVDTLADEPALMCYTSGTTGRPKGIVHAQRWIVARGEANRARVPPCDGDVVLAAGEWSFISLLGHNVLFALRNGVTAAAMEGHPSPEKFLDAIARFKVTVAHAVPTIYRRILAIDGIEQRYESSSLRGCNASGEALGATTLQAWKQRFGSDIWEHYGISEMQLAISHGPRLPIKPGSIGVPWGADARIMDDQHNQMPDGEIGELVIRADNPSFFLGYHKDAAKTAEVVHDGWFHTGDLARRDADGYFWIAGRNDDCFKSRGIFIVPVEIENALMQHPDVAEACVVPQKDSADGNLIRAFVALKGTARGDATLAEQRPDELRTFLKARLARNKIPHVFEIVAELPKSATGKVLRRELIGRPSR